jgi:potassium-dependent mechanosensitive channel
MAKARLSVRTRMIFLLTLTVSGIYAPGFSQVKKHLLQGQQNKYKDSLVVRADTSVPVIINKIENYSYIIDHTNFLFKNPLNISPIYLELNQTEKRLEGFKARLEQKGKEMNLRSINSSVILLKEMADKLFADKRTLSNYSDQLSISNSKVKKIISDPTLKMQLTDSVLNEQLNDLLIEGKSLDSLQGQVLGRVNLLQNHVAIDLLQARDIISDMGYLSIEKKMLMWQQEEAPLFEILQQHYNRGLGDVFFESIQRSFKIIVTYLSGKWQILSLGFLIAIFLFIWTVSNFYRVKNSTDGGTAILAVQFLSKGLVANSLLAFLTYSNYFFANPPMSYLHSVEVLRLFLLGFTLFPFLTKRGKITGTVMAILWILFAFDDILLESAFGERWILFLAALSLAGLCIQCLGSRKPFFVFIKEPVATKLILSVALTLSVLSVFFNITGRLSLAKIAGITAIQTVVLALTLWVFFTLLLEAVYLQFKASTHRRVSGMFDFQQLQAKSQGIVWTFALIAWTLSIVRNLTFYDEMIKVLSDFINTKRGIGNMSFTFESVGVFVLIIWISFALSQSVNFFFGSETVTDTKKKGKIGSLMLLIRLGIWIVGFLIGVSAAGIALDKLSLMIGAFGVGIGFGLQNIVNNLVSGVILAFERPIQVGDSIEVGNKSGVVREIGVRSSKIENAEGAAIIIPNGDLLSQQLVNWTMHDNSRRLDFMLTFPFPSDIEKIKSIVITELQHNKSIMQNPPVAVNVQEFQPNAVQMKIMWWVADLHLAGTVRSEVMQKIYETLNNAGVSFEK